MSVTLNGQQILLILAKYGPVEYADLKELENKKVSIQLRSNAKGNFYATFEEKEETDETNQN